jgi:hypothetical protein
MQTRTSWKIAGGLCILSLAGCITVLLLKGDTGFKTRESELFINSAVFLFLVMLFCVARAFPRHR